MRLEWLEQVSYHNRRGKRLARDKAERRIEQRFSRSSKKRQARAYRWNETGPKRAVSGELISDAAGAVWSALWRRGA